MRVKPLSPTHVFVASLATGLGLLLFWSNYHDEDGHIDHFGSTLATSLASQVVEPFVAQDLIHLGVLANRTMELPEVIGTNVFTVDDKMLILSGDVTRGRPFTHPIVHDGGIIGYIRLYIDETEFGEELHPALVILSLLWITAMPALVIWGSILGSRLIPAGALSHYRRDRDIGPIPEAPSAAVSDEPVPDYVVTVNLFNQLSLTPEQSARELDFARETANSVASLYQADVEDLPGTGLMLIFHAANSDDRPFHAICAAFALCALFESAETWGRYRLGAHIVWSHADQQSNHDAGASAIADAAILSALARDNTIAISDALYAHIPYPHRILSDTMDHPLLEELPTIGGKAHLARNLAEPHQALIDQQVSDLPYPPARSTARESTF